MINTSLPLGASIECASCGVEHDLPLITSIKKGSSIGITFALCPACTCTLISNLKTYLKEAISRGEKQ